MESIISEILDINNKFIKVLKVFEIKREILDSNICHSIFIGTTGTIHNKYFIKFNYETKEIIVLHKDIRKQYRGKDLDLKEQFWRKWDPSQFSNFKDENRLKFEMMNDLDLVINKFNGDLKRINWDEI